MHPIPNVDYVAIQPEALHLGLCTSVTLLLVGWHLAILNSQDKVIRVN